MSELKLLRVVSLGAGVQSSAMLLMGLRGEFGDRPDVAFFADTGAEPESVYTWLGMLRMYAADIDPGFEIKTIRAYDHKTLYDDIGCIPLFVGGLDGKPQITKRSCTQRYKITALDRHTRKRLGLKPGQRWMSNFGTAEVWLGISVDEVQRMKVSTDKWRVFRHPLIEDVRFRREDCQNWLERNGYGSAPRSACVFCPFHSDHEWARLKEHEPKAFAQAVALDRGMRSGEYDMGKLRGTPYLHSSLRPLDEIDFTNQKQLGFDWNIECAGVCGV